MKKYQIAVLISAKLDQNKAREEFDAFKAILTNHKAQNQVELSFNQRQLAYKINKENNAYYGYVDFDIDPQNLPSIEEELRLEKAILRYLITVWEDYKVESRDKRDIKEPGAEKPKSTLTTTKVSAEKEEKVELGKTEEKAKKSSTLKKPTKDEKEDKKEEKKEEKPKKISKKDLDKKLEELLGE